MKREIKFRVWDTPDGGLTGKWFWPKENYGHALDYAVKFNKPVMQYTGLKDRNGKEVFEGDIIKYEGCEGYWDYFGVIEWCEENAAFHININNGDAYSMIFDEIEIIGNIYENPELL